MNEIEPKPQPHAAPGRPKYTMTELRKYYPDAVARCEHYALNTRWVVTCKIFEKPGSTRVVGAAVAICNPEDVPNPNIGEMIATGRAVKDAHVRGGRQPFGLVRASFASALMGAALR